MDDRTLGLVAAIRAPALLVEGFLMPAGEDPLIVALWRARFVPMWVPTAVLVGTAVSFAGPPGALFFTVGTASWLVGLGYVGVKVLWISGAEWERGELPDREGASRAAEARAA